MQLSKLGKKFTKGSGILQLMDDLGKAMSGKEELYMLGGGNPAHIPEIEDRLRQEMNRILQTPDEFEKMIGNYDTPQGEVRFIESLAQLLRTEFNWDVSPENIALTTGSQTAFFILFNILAGEFEDGTVKKIMLPLTPEYIGYADCGITPDFFVSRKPEIDLLDDTLFKYRVDFERLAVTDEVAAICVSRPTNPTGNVLTNEEIYKLSNLAAERNIPLIIDNAYGIPFPRAIYTEAGLPWKPGMILCMSLSKFGLPATRTGIIVAEEDVIRAVSGMTAIFSLAPTSMGAYMTRELISSGEIIRLSRDVINPFYKKKADAAVKHLRESITSPRFHIHKPEGAFFLWLWFEGLPITSQELYENLRKQGVLVVPGHYFFPGLAEEWDHKTECIRITYAQDEKMVAEGLDIIAREINRLL